MQTGMKKSFLGELYFKAFKSGNPLNLFIAINVLLFLFINLVGLVGFFAGIELRSLITPYLAVPADPGILLFRPWTLVTYMFTQEDLFHLLFNMLWLYWLGMIFLDFLNKRQFIFTYLAGGLSGAAIFLILYNIVPAFRQPGAWLIGSSGSVYAIVVAAATLLPDYTIRLLFFGNVRLKYLALVFIVLNVLGLSGANIGGSLAHLGGALLGFLFVIQLRKGHDWSKVLERKRRKMTVIRNPKAPNNRTTHAPNQEYIDSILDKISQSGYASLSKHEKEALFNASRSKDPS